MQSKAPGQANPPSAMRRPSTVWIALGLCALVAACGREPAVASAPVAAPAATAATNAAAAPATSAAPATPAAPAAGACPASDFPGFLKAFAAQAQTRQAFTADQVWVKEFADEDDYQIRRVAIDKSRYNGFNLTHRGDGYHVVDSGGQADPAPVKLDITPQAGGAYLVYYDYGVSEGRSFLFASRQGCWYLSEEPTDPVP